MKNLPYWVVDTLRCALIVAIGLLVIWLLFSVGSLFGPDGDSWKAENIDWDYGAIVLDGENDKVNYSSGFDSLYTKDLIECTGYEITVSFPAGVKLDVYYFDTNDNLVSHKTIADERFVSLKPGDSEFPASAVGIRLCLTPDNGADFELGLGIGNLFQKWKYAGYVDLDITNVVPAT